MTVYSIGSLQKSKRKIWAPVIVYVELDIRGGLGISTVMATVMQHKPRLEYSIHACNISLIVSLVFLLLLLPL